MRENGEFKSCAIAWFYADCCVFNKQPDAGLAVIESLITELSTAAGLSIQCACGPVAPHPLIDGESLAEDINRIAGKDFLKNVRAQHIAYGNMVAAMLKRENALSEDLSEHVRVMGQELVEYATKVLASVDRDKPCLAGIPGRFSSMTTQGKPFTKSVISGMHL